MKIKLNEDVVVVERVKNALKANDGYCPCQVGKKPETKCVCKNFKEKTPVGDLCICELYRKIDD